mmetsp:Transcript_45047/g.88650  ORF Transcript_45047/g.88650 Transcript_45047/m.88650 type:complete len:156 (+) Transcript_45047:150-617(+)
MDAGPLEGIKDGLIIFANGIQRKDGVKQSLADAMAGSIEKPDTVLAEALAKTQAAGCFMYTWSMSPACKQAVAALDRMGASYETVELDQPWKEGNPVRAVLGKHLGKTSVPMIFIGGEYVGGFSDGPSDEAPGLVNLAFDGKLRPLLKAAGALAE